MPPKTSTKRVPAVTTAPDLPARRFYPAPSPRRAPVSLARRELAPFAALRPPGGLQLLRFLTGVLMGLVIGVTLMMAVALLPGIFGLYPMVVVSGSMEPTIHAGDIAVVRKLDPYRLQLGDVVTYSALAGSITHRIIGLDLTPQGPFFLVKGDANLTADPRAVPANRIVGKVMYRIPKLGFLVAFTDSAVGRFLFIGAPLFLLALLWFRRTVSRRLRPAQSPIAARRDEGSAG